MPERKYDPWQHAMLYFCSRTDIDYWNTWRREHPAIEICLEEVDFTSINLRKADLHGAFLQRTDLRRTDLQDVNLQGASFYGANLKKTRFLDIQLPPCVRIVVTSKA